MAAKRIPRTKKPDFNKNEGTVLPEPCADGRVKVEVFTNTFVFCLPSRVELVKEKFRYLNL